MIGEKLGPFLIQAELGSGAMGVVYRGFNAEKNRTAAIKVIAEEQVGKGKNLQRFQREAEILKAFKHPNIVRIMGTGTTGGKYFYAMEYITGPTLDRVIRDRGPLPWQEVVALGIQLCEALQYAHDHKIVHRDLKPSNLMLTEKGQLKLTDFGIAKDLDATTALTGTGRTMGTAAYMAPEQIRGTPAISSKTDLYSLGAVFYQMLTGEPPFSGATAVVMMHAHINEAPRRPSSKIQEIPRALDNLVVQLMAKDPVDRPFDAMAVAHILQELQEKASKQETIRMVWAQPDSTSAESPKSVDQEPASKKASKSRKKKKTGPSTKETLEIAGLVGALVVVASLIGYLLWPKSAGYLYRQAAILMASENHLEWIKAREEYIEPLDRKYPEHPYHETTSFWLDQIDLFDAERRAEVLEKINLLAISKPKTEAEATYQYTFQEADAALRRHHDRDAEALWIKMEKQLTKTTRDDRGWVLLARSKAKALDKVIQQRQKTVTGLLAQAAIPDPHANVEARRKYSRAIYEDIITRFGDYPDVGDLLAQAKAGLQSVENAESQPDLETPEKPATRTNPSSPPKF